MYDAKQLKQRINVQDFASTALALPLVGETGRDKQLTGACPKCGGTKRFNVFADGWFCRDCKPLVKGKNHDVFELAMHANKATTFKDAVNFVGDWLRDPATVAMPAATSATKSNRMDWTCHEWQIAAEKAAHSGVILLTKTIGKPGVEYLQKRCLTLETCEQWGVGFGNGWSAATKSEHYGVKFVWRDEQGRITGVRTRFLDDKAAKQKYGWFMYPHSRETGSTGHSTLYRLIDSNSDTLVIVEGEINALSIWQTLGCHVVSFGSESMTLDAKHEAAALALNYRRVMIWADKDTVGQELEKTIPGSKSIKSPFGMDANNLLVDGRLQPFLQRVIERKFGVGETVTAIPTREETTVPAIGDLTAYVGADIDAATWAALQAECKLRYGDLWRFTAIEQGDRWHVTKLEARP